MAYVINCAFWFYSLWFHPMLIYCALGHIRYKQTAVQNALFWQDLVNVEEAEKQRSGYQNTTLTLFCLFFLCHPSITDKDLAVYNKPNQTQLSDAEKLYYLDRVPNPPHDVFYNFSNSGI